MKIGWTIIFAASLIALLVVIIRNRASRSWVKRLCLQLVAAALLLYFLNFSGVISGFHIPLNPITAATVILLGVPGIFLILGLEWVII